MKAYDVYLEEYNDTWYADRYRWQLEMLAAAIEKAGTADPVKVAFALEGMTHPGAFSEVTMRADDHQIQLPLVVSTLTADAAKTVVYEKKDFGVGFKTDGVATLADTTLPTTCKMERPKM